MRVDTNEQRKLENETQAKFLLTQEVMDLTDEELAEIYGAWHSHHQHHCHHRRRYYNRYSCGCSCGYSYHRRWW